MDAKEYQKIYQNIKTMAPIESGVQTLVYMFLYDIMKDRDDYQLIVIDRMSKKTQFVTPAGISDLAIVDKNFNIHEECKDKILSYVEVKTIDVNLFDFEKQIKGQLLSRGKIFCTNGNVWKYYDIYKYIEKNSQDEINRIWAQRDYDGIRGKFASLEDIEMQLAIIKSSRAHSRSDEYKKSCDEEIKNLEENKNEICNKLKGDFLVIPWLDKVMEMPIINRQLYGDNGFSVKEYLKLKSELYSLISDLPEVFTIRKE